MLRAAGIVCRVNVLRKCYGGPRLKFNSGYVYASTTISENLSTVAKTKPIISDVTVDRFGLRRFLDVHRLSSVLLGPEDRRKSFESVWDILMSRPDRDVSLVNKYLFSRTDCGVDFNCDEVLRSMAENDLKPNTRTFGAFIHQSCAKGDMEETSIHLQGLKQANLKPDLYIFSQILHGYVKAGCMEEVASTKEIMARMGLWPSRLGYEGILTAYAELGNRTDLLTTLNETWEFLLSQSKMNSLPSNNFLPMFVIQLYVKLLSAEPHADGTCAELISRIPIPVDPLTCSRAREGTKRLLVNGRLLAAQELFKRADPESADDAYLISLPKYIEAGGIDPDAVSTFWRLADVSGSRLSMLRRQVFNNSRRLPVKSSAAYEVLRDAISRKDVNGIFDYVKNQPVSVGLVYNYLAPQLLRLGVSPMEIVDRIEPSSLRSAAAFGCLLSSLAPHREVIEKQPVNYEDVEKMLTEFINKGVLPITDYIQLALQTVRQLVLASQPSTLNPEEKMSKSLHLIGKAVSPAQLKALVCQLFEHCLYPYSGNFKLRNRQPTQQDENALNSLVDACISQDIKFPSNHWVFYNLDNCPLPKEKIDQIKLPPLPTQPQRDAPRPVSLWKRLHGWLSAGDVESTINAIKKASEHPYSMATSGHSQMVSDTRFPDAVAIACEVLQQARDNQGAEENISYPLSAQDVERIFWASWDEQILPNALRAISQVAQTYNKSSDFKGMANFFGRASKQLGALQDALLMPSFMRSLLSDNFSENLKLLQSMVSNSYISTAMFTNGACLLEDILATNHPDQFKELPEFQRSSDEYWPPKVLSKRLHGLSHLQKLRTIHNAVEDLCKANSLFAAHSLRMWANDLGLLIFPKTNELLVLTPYMTPSFERQTSLPHWCMSHELSQHSPINLDHRLLSTLDSIILNRNAGLATKGGIAEIVKSTAAFLVDHVCTGESQVNSNGTGWLPTWLVVCQRLHQTGSAFTDPHSYILLAQEVLKQGLKSRSNVLPELDHWFLYTPTTQHKAALLLASLSNPLSQTWALEKLRSHPDLLNTACSKLYFTLSPEQQDQLTDVFTKLNRQHTLSLAVPLVQTPVDLAKLKSICDNLSSNEMCKELAAYVLCTENLLKSVVEFLHDKYPETLIPFFNELFAKLNGIPRRVRLVRLAHELMSEFSLNVTDLSARNQAFLYAAYRVLNFPRPDLRDPLEHLNHILPEQLRTSWLKEVKSAMAGEDFIALYEHLNKLDPEYRDSAVFFVTSSLPGLAETSRLKKFMVVIAEHGDGHMLNVATSAARPFLLAGIGDAYLSLARMFNNEKLTWLDRACIRYHKLGPLLQRKPSSDSPSAGENHAIDELTILMKQPISSVVQTLLKVQSEPEKLKSTVTQFLHGWSTQRKSVLLSYLVSEGATTVIQCMDEMTPGSPNRLPLLEFAQIVKASQEHSSDKSEPISQYAQAALQKLHNLEPKEINACLRGPHAEPLFRSWPTEHLDVFFNVVNEASERERTSLNLQLAAIMINRDRHDLAKQVNKSTGPLPITFLSGSPRHILSEPELQSTLSYLNDNDPEHVNAFIDTCLRNAVSTNSSRQTNDLVKFVRVVSSQPYTFNLQEVCLLPTIHLISDYLDRTPKLPKDVKEILRSVVEHSSPAQRRSPVDSSH